MMKGVTKMINRLCFYLSLAAMTSLCLAATLKADPLSVSTTNNANALANALLSSSSGITIKSATYTGAANASGTFSGGTGIIGF